MRRIGGNDVLEVWAVSRASDPIISAGATMMHADRQTQDQRFKLLVEFVKLQSHTAVMAGQLKEGSGFDVGEAPNAATMVMRAAALVDALWDEGMRRGWIVDLPAYDRAFDRREQEE